MGDSRASTSSRGPGFSWWLVGLPLAGVAVALLSRHLVFPAYSWNRDEPVYLWQVAGLRAGQITSPTGGFPQFFHPWLAGLRDHSFFSQYTLGWPLVLLAGDVVFGSPDAAIALGAALTVLGTFLLTRVLTGEERVARVAAVVMLLSPILPIQGGVYLGYLFTLGLGLLFATATISGVRRSGWVRLVVGGLLLGWIFMTRPFDAVLWGAAVVLLIVWEQRRNVRGLIRPGLMLALGFAPLVVATLLYNRHVTGAFTQFPITAADALDTFGFGKRRIMPTFRAADYGVLQGLRSSIKQVALLPLFLGGGYVLAGLAAWRLWRERADFGTRILIALGLAFPVGYFFFWGIFVSSATMPLSGPIYYIPCIAVLAIAGASELVRWWDTRRSFALGIVAAMVVVTVPVAIDRIDVNRRISRSQLPWERSSAAAPAHSLVFVWRAGDYLLFLNPFSANRPNLDGPVLWAVDHGARDFALMDAYPDRRPFLQRTSIPPDGQVPNDHPETPEVTLTPIRVVQGGSVVLRTSVRGGRLPAGARLYARMFGEVVNSWPAVGGASAELRVRAGAAPVGPDGVIHEYGLDGVGTITLGIGRGTTAADAAAHPLYRQDLHYRVQDGTVAVMTPYEEFHRVVWGDTRRWAPLGPGVASPVSLTTDVHPPRT